MVTLAVYPLVRPGSSHFAGKAMGVRAVLYPAMMLVMATILWPAPGTPATLFGWES